MSNTAQWVRLTKKTMPRKRKNERSDGRIQIQLDIGRDASGKRVRKFFYGNSRAEAERKKAEYIAAQQGFISDNDITLSEWIDAYLGAYRTKVNTLYIQQSNAPYNRLKDSLGARPVRTIRELDLQHALNSVSGMSFSTCSKYLQAIKQVFKKARKNGIIKDDPAEDLSLPSYTKGSHRALTKQEIDLVLKYWPESPAGLWAMIMLFAGLRRGEMMALDWSAVDLTGRTITVRQTAVIQGNAAIVEQRTKTAAGLRVIPIPDPLFAALSTVENKTGFVCLSARKKPLTESAVSRGLDRFCNVITRYINDKPKNPSKANRVDDLPKHFAFRTHDLRHTYCSLLYAAGVDVKTAAYLMGHSDITVTMKIYTHLSEDKKTLSVQNLTAYLDSHLTANSTNQEVPSEPTPESEA